MTDEEVSRPAQVSGASGLSDFALRVVIAVLIVAVALALWRLRDAIAIGFGSIVLAVSALGLADDIGRRTGLPRRYALPLVLGLAALVMLISIAVFGATVAAQFNELGRKLPESLRLLEARARTSPLGADLVGRLEESMMASGAGSLPKIAGAVLSALAGLLTYGLITVFGAVFLAIDPGRYHRGFIRLVPPSQRALYARTLDRVGETLHRWMVSRLVVMVVVGVLSSLGLWALGIDAPLALGLTGAILTFIPNIGSVMSAIPAGLIGFVQEPTMALYVAVLFWFVHFVEGTFITPYIQDEAVDVPPVVSIFSTLVFTVLLGPVGVVLSGPLMVVSFVAVQALYLEEVLGEPRAPAAARGLRAWLAKLTRRRQRRSEPGES